MTNSKNHTNIVWRTMGVPDELHAEIGEISRAEERSRHVVVKRALAAYRQQQSETAAART
ncbi:ribbon-helix-helix protein, CopG family [Mycobacterium sp. 94-17]|uniref:ribbon-helix-helix protein, CopG family n=1 Tax=Mycobacterium sp. 94-17 TaxID=2986147 RepID=UPI002D1EF783|nr:ribbon-helix-helix protein, CopG family [Mycobacterium sp. 94-17]MEB4212324.1 ribbon-helix-helix protein, CopG family [Mycobacterium sp. 94-17]